LIFNGFVDFVIMRLKSGIKISFGLLLSIGLIVFLLVKIDIVSVKKSLISFNYLTIIFLLIVFILGMLVRT